MKIVNLLNDLYTRFDTLTDSRKNPFVYKASPGHILMWDSSESEFQGPTLRGITSTFSDSSHIDMQQPASVYLLFTIFLNNSLLL